MPFDCLVMKWTSFPFSEHIIFLFCFLFYSVFTIMVSPSHLGLCILRFASCLLEEGRVSVLMCRPLSCHFSRSNSFLKYVFYVYECVCVCASCPHKVSDPPELDLEPVVSCHVVAGTKLGSSGRTESTLSYWAISPILLSNGFTAFHTALMLCLVSNLKYTEVSGSVQILHHICSPRYYRGCSNQFVLVPWHTLYSSASTPGACILMIYTHLLVSLQWILKGKLPVIKAAYS